MLAQKSEGTENIMNKISFNPPNHFKTLLSQRPEIIDIALPAISVLFGLEILRVLVSGLTWTIGDRFGLGAVYLGGISLIIFGFAFLSGGIGKLLGERRAIIVSAGGIGLARLLIQVWWGEPLISIVLAMLGTIFFVSFLPLYLTAVLKGGHKALSYLVVGIVIGFMLDVMFHGAFATYDFIWQQDAIPVLLGVLLVVVQWLLLVALPQTKQSDSFGSNGVSLKSLTWLAIGPFIFLQLVVFQNIARLATLSHWPLPAAFGWLLLSQLMALILAVWLIKQTNIRQWVLSLLSGILLIAISLFPLVELWASAVFVLLGQLALTTLMTLVISNLSVKGHRKSNNIIAIASGTGMLLLVILLLAYYAVYQITLPYDNTTLECIAAVIIAVCALLASIKTQPKSEPGPVLWRVPAVMAITLILPLLQIFTWQAPQADMAGGFPLRIMSYNLHNGFDAYGKLDMETLAQVIENNQPDIVALQEISRGWLISGRVDMLLWLSHRLGMPYVSGPTSDAFWGSAILSRYPIIQSQTYELPPRNLFLLRGYTYAQIDLGQNRSINIIATHFHHVGEDSDIRFIQSQALVDFWKKQDNTIILGDFNAEPDSQEIGKLFAAGLVDSLAAKNDSTVYTYHASNLYQRIDYIWLSADLKVIESFVIDSTASDHRPVMAVISR
jgi:endonuclease/exonuclease/phosphatase family metal-dependent hydrolase